MVDMNGFAVPNRLAKDLIDLETRNGTNPDYLRNLSSQLTFLFGSGYLSRKLRQVITHLASPLTPTPAISHSNESFGYKNAAFAGMQFMHAATAMGLATCPMEGFDERRLCYSLNIPMEEYGIPFVICLGYAQEDKNNEETLEGLETAVSALEESLRGVNEKVRFPFHEMFFYNSFGNSFPVTEDEWISK